MRKIPKTQTPVHIRVDTDDWRKFRAYCIAQGTNATARIRQFIKRENSKNQEVGK